MTGMERDLFNLARKSTAALETIADELSSAQHWKALRSRLGMPGAAPADLVTEILARLDVAEIDNADLCRLNRVVSSELSPDVRGFGTAGRRVADVAIDILRRIVKVKAP